MNRHVIYGKLVYDGSEIDFDEIVDFSDISEKFLADTLAKFTKQYNVKRKRICTKNLSDYDSDLCGEGWKLQEMYPDILRKSLFVAGFSLFENELLHICEAYQSQEKYKLSLSDLKHDGITKYRVYLKKVVGIAFPDNTPEWNAITFYNKTRNFIVHKEGLIDDSSNGKSVRQFVEKSDDAEIDSVNRIKLKSTFVSTFSDVAKRVMRDIYEVLHDDPTIIYHDGDIPDFMK